MELEQFMKGLVQLPTTAGVMQIFSTLMIPVLHSLINWHISPVPLTALQKLILNKSFYSLHVCAGFMCIYVCSLGNTVLSVGVLVSPCPVSVDSRRTKHLSVCRRPKQHREVYNSAVLAHCRTRKYL